MPIETNLYRWPSNALDLKQFGEYYKPPTAAEYQDIETSRIRNRLNDIRLRETEQAVLDEQARVNYLLSLPQYGAVPGAQAASPMAPQPAAVTPPSPSPQFDSGWRGPLSTDPKPVQGGSIMEQPGPAPTVVPTPGIPATISSPALPPLDGSDLPRPRNRGELVAREQEIARRQALFDQIRKQKMDAFTPLYKALVDSGDDSAFQALLSNAGNDPYMSGTVSWLKNVKVTGPGETTYNGSLTREQLESFVPKAATPEMEGLIRNAPPGNYKVKSKNGRVIEFEMVPEKAVGEEILISRSLRQTLGREPTPAEILAEIDRRKALSGEEKNKSEYQQAKALIAERLGRQPTEREIHEQLMRDKKEIAAVQASGRVSGTYTNEEMVKLAETHGKLLAEGREAPSQVRNTFGVPLSNLAIAEAIKLNPNYNVETAEANFQWYKSTATQRMIRRTASIMDEGGALDEMIRLAKLVDNPAGTPINKVKGQVGVALGDSRRQLLDAVTNLSAEEQQQIFGAVGGGEKFLLLAQSLADPNLSVEQYVNAAKEIRYMIYTRQKANVEGTPLQRKWEYIGARAAAARPYLKESQQLEIKELTRSGYVFKNEKELEAAVKSGKVKPGQRVVVDGKLATWD